MPRVLIIDDDAAMTEVFMRTVRTVGHEVQCAATLADGLRIAFEASPDVVFLDVRLPDGNGLDAMEQVRAVPSRPEVIIFTGEGDPDAAELAIRGGAWDYIEKPASIAALLLPLRRAIEFRAERQQHQAPTALRRDAIVGDSPKLRACLDQLAHAAATDVAVLVSGETGTGKELFALTIHQNSQRRGGNFVVVDCAALPAALVESTLFGHERGAFPGADRPVDGLVRQAHGGTLFLDEVAELPLTMQKALLRVMQERRVRPVGGRVDLPSDVRIIASTNRDLDRLSSEGQFRSDLLFTLRPVHIQLPALRDRRGDIRDLVTHHLTRLCQRLGGVTRGLSPEFLEALETYDWPGNVRELVFTLEQALVASHGEPILYPNHLPVALRVHLAKASLRSSDPERTPQVADLPALPSFRAHRTAAVLAAEKRYLGDLMLRARGDIQRACALSGLSRPRLYALLSKHHITRQR